MKVATPAFFSLEISGFIFLPFFLLSVANFVGAAVVSETQPNIIVVMADDLDVNSLNTLRDLGLMPNLQQWIIDTSWEFSESFVTNSLCCPSRASFLTGQYSHNNGVLKNSPPYGSVSYLNDGSTIGTWLQTAGYRTGYVGKYLHAYGLLADAPEDHPYNPNYIPPGWDDWQALIDPTAFWMYGYRINDNGTIVTHGDATVENPEHYQTDVLTRRSTEFIAESLTGVAPFFLALMPTAPHVEVCPGMLLWDPECIANIDNLTVRPAPRHESHGVIYGLPLPMTGSFNEADLSDKPAWVQQVKPLDSTAIDTLTTRYRDRLASMLAIDDLIGSIVAELQKHAGELENTVIIFTSDNGYLLGEHGLQEKTYAYEEAIRVPLFIRLPTPGTQTSSKSTKVVLNNDLAPTIAALASASPPVDHIVDGRSLVPIIENPGLADWRKGFLVEHWRENLSLAPTYLALRTDPAGWLGSPVPNQLLVNYFPAEGDDPQTQEFYDMSTDPLQLVSLHDSKKWLHQVQRWVMIRWMAALWRCKGDHCRKMEDFDFSN